MRNVKSKSASFQELERIAAAAQRATLRHKEEIRIARQERSSAREKAYRDKETFVTDTRARALLFLVFGDDLVFDWDNLRISSPSGKRLYSFTSRAPIDWTIEHGYAIEEEGSLIPTEKSKIWVKNHRHNDGYGLKHSVLVELGIAEPREYLQVRTEHRLRNEHGIDD